MNKIRNIWYISKFDIKTTLDYQILFKIIYSNIKSCINVPNIRQENKILENDFNSLFQTTLFDFLFEEFELFDYYDKLFAQRKYVPKNNENLFGSFIFGYKNYFYEISKDKNKLKKLKKIRWYLWCDKDNFYKEEKNYYEEINLFKSNLLQEFHEEVENDNDSFDEVQSKLLYKDYNSNKDNDIDIIDENFENNIITEEIINKLLTNEDNPLFYVIKLICLTMASFCKATMCFIIALYSSNNKNISENKNELIKEFSKRFNNYVDSCKIINKKCENINIAINYLYKELFVSYPNFPKFSIFRLCIKIWYNEMTSILIGDYSLLNLIKKNISKIFSSYINEDLINKINNNSQNDIIKKNDIKSFLGMSPFIKNESFDLNLSSSIFMFQSENIGNNYNSSDAFSDIFCPFGSEYEDDKKKYNIIEKGLSIIYDTFSNEYSVNLLNLTSIEVNNYYQDIENNFCNIIEEVLSDIFLNENKLISFKSIVDKILEYFDSYFFSKRIIPKLKNKIYLTVFNSIKNNLFIYIKNKYNDNILLSNINLNINSNYNNNSISTNNSSNYNMNMNLKSSMFGFSLIEENNNFNNQYEKEIIDFIIKETSTSSNKNNINLIQKFINELNEKKEVFEIMKNIHNWYDNHQNEIKKHDKKVRKELLKKDFSLNYNKLQRTILSYSIDCNWEKIKKIKAIEQYFKKINDTQNNDNEDIKMNEEDDLNIINSAHNFNTINNNSMNIEREENHLDEQNDDFGMMYMGDNENGFDGGDDEGNNNNLNNINLKSSNFFDI